MSKSRSRIAKYLTIAMGCHKFSTFSSHQYLASGFIPLVRKASFCPTNPLYCKTNVVRNPI